ncbi:hypothetical protein BGZ61DRAFT_487239 [Ilyonectria robusta]|uniref:uncharacterized protein n=1 Tax=Ilyonectria robusta TaxID=1079257 RepID=UPI001E8E11FB|nr:uncharacterized protein BGZ61DRAFT_487239 [Ilyonectria robusta]KAH8653909.1 hypothetical protein BGZ61DRAFT_487239 [Ilyonectria robusta]
MSLPYPVSTALTTAFILSAAANLSTSVKAILRYRNTQRNHRETQLVITHCVIATGSALVFVVLMQERGDPWSTYLSSSIIVSSMIREHHPLASQSAVVNELSAASAITFRCWMVLEWVLIASCISRQFTKIKTVMLIETFAMIASVMALKTESSTSRHLILSNVFGAHDFLVCLIPVVENLWTKSFRGRPNPSLLPRLLQRTWPRASSPWASSQVQLRGMSVTTESEAQ